MCSSSLSYALMYMLPTPAKLNFLFTYKMCKMSTFVPQAILTPKVEGKYGNFLKLKSIDFLNKPRHLILMYFQFDQSSINETKGSH